MKELIIITCIIIIALVSCDHPKKTRRRIERDLTIAEKDFIPYQLNDTFSFSDGKGGLLYFTCTLRSDVREDRALSSCFSHDDDYCDIENEENLKVILTCNDTIYNIRLVIWDTGKTFWLNFYNFPNPHNGSPGYAFGGSLNVDSLCQLYSFCSDSAIINSKKYYQVDKMYNYYGYNPNSIDSVYYKGGIGMLRFCTNGVNGIRWTKR